MIFHLGARCRDFEVESFGLFLNWEDFRGRCSATRGGRIILSWPLLTSVARLPSGGESGGVGGFIRRCSGGSMLLVGMKEGELKDFIGEAMRNCLALVDSSGDVDFEEPFGDFLFVTGNFLGDDWAPLEG